MSSLPDIDIRSQSQNEFVQDWLQAFLTETPSDERDAAIDITIEAIQEIHGDKGDPYR